MTMPKPSVGEVRVVANWAKEQGLLNKAVLDLFDFADAMETTERQDRALGAATWQAKSQGVDQIGSGQWMRKWLTENGWTQTEDTQLDVIDMLGEVGKKTTPPQFKSLDDVPVGVVVIDTEGEVLWQKFTFDEAPLPVLHWSFLEAHKKVHANKSWARDWRGGNSGHPVQRPPFTTFDEYV